MLCNVSKEAKEIMTSARSIICRKHTIFLDAIYQLQLEEDASLLSPMISNGIKLYYNPEILCHMLQLHGMDSVVYSVLHICCHCILGHIMPREFVKNQDLYDVLADYKVYNLLSALRMEKSQKEENPLKKMHLDYPHFPLHVAYRQLIKEPNKAERYLKLAEHLEVDTHDLWKHQPPERGTEGNAEGNAEGSGSQNQKDSQNSLQYVAIKKWSEIKKKMLEDNPELIGATGHGFGNEIGNEIWLYDVEDQSETDYKKILENFFQKTSVEIENHNAIDPMWYHFGLDYLEDIPLIEPQEEDEQAKNGTLLIALDTSGSCEGEVCHRFLGELHNMMNQCKAMDTLEQVVLFQCDAEIHEEVEIANPDQWLQLTRDFQVKGGGGTDFCPVFERGNQYQDVVGLIYLSDGMGSFPEREPAYPTLFLLTDSEYFDHYNQIPQWVERAYF